MEEKEATYVITATLDGASLACLDGLRKKYFPAEINFIPAHLSIFHKVPHTSLDVLTTAFDASLTKKTFSVAVGPSYSLGKGVALKIVSSKLERFRADLAAVLLPILFPQDRQKYNPHITIQNKVSPETARKTLDEIAEVDLPLALSVQGITVWRYMNGPWKFEYELKFPV